MIEWAIYLERAHAREITCDKFKLWVEQRDAFGK